MQIERRFTSLQGTSVVVLLVLIAVGSTLASYRGKVAQLGDDENERGLHRGAFHGTKEFTQSGTFTVPDDVATILVEIYGAGGGGGGESETVGFQGGGGGAGAFSRSVIHVRPRSTLTVSVGVGGANGKYSSGEDEPPATNGEDGGDSSVSFNGIPLIIAYGGKGGQASTQGGAPGAGGAVDPGAMISHAGENGGPGVSPSGTGGRPGTGYQLLGLPIDGVGVVSSGGLGISGDCYVQGCSGLSGYVLLTY